MTQPVMVYCECGRLVVMSYPPATIFGLRCPQCPKEPPKPKLRLVK